MKIFSIENNQESVYVQLADLAMLHVLDSKLIPDPIRRVKDKEVNIFNIVNMKKFLLFSQPEEVAFFKAQDWIINYQEVQSLNSDEVLDECDKVAEEIELLLKDDCDEETKMQCYLLEHKFNSLSKFLEVKQGKAKIILPNADNISLENKKNTLIRCIHNKAHTFKK